MSAATTEQLIASILDTLGLHIRAARVGAGMRQRDLAAALSVTQPAVCYWEAGSRIPDPARLPAIAGATGVTLAHLVTGVPSESDDYDAGFHAGWQVHAAAFDAVRRHLAEARSS